MSGLDTGSDERAIARPGWRRESQRAAVAFFACCLALFPGCFYTSATVNLREFEGRGVSMERFDKRDTGVQHYGRVRLAERTWAFGSCDETAERALHALLAKARARGANRVLHTHFRGRWRWMREPVCRRNLGYFLLIVPAFLPVPTSVTVYGEAVYDPSLGSRGARSGLANRTHRTERVSVPPPVRRSENMPLSPLPTSLGSTRKAE